MKGETFSDAAIVMDDSDTVATALEDLEAGREFDVDGGFVTLEEDVPFGHKFALQPIEEGEAVRKYAEVIGEATTPIAAGKWVHTHNVISRRARPGVDADGDGDSTTAGGDK